jgi:Na+/H+-dicarboxylate symporter
MFVAATSSLDPAQNGKLGALQVTYLALTNLLGALMGIGLGATIQPGEEGEEARERDRGVVLTWASILERPYSMQARGVGEIY